MRRPAMWEMKATRDAFGEALVELGRLNGRVVVLSADLEDSTRAEYFKKEFPDRFFNLGISEQDMLGASVGLSLDGFIPFACSFAVFITDRTYGVLRVSICYNKANVKLIGTHAGLTVGEDGATAQSLEDIAIMRALPNMVVVTPVDAVETRKATFRIAEVSGPVYMRLGRAKYPVITKESDAFELGKANMMMPITTTGATIARIHRTLSETHPRSLATSISTITKAAIHVTISNSSHRPRVKTVSPLPMPGGRNG